MNYNEIRKDYFKNRQFYSLLFDTVYFNINVTKLNDYDNPYSTDLYGNQKYKIVSIEIDNNKTKCINKKLLNQSENLVKKVNYKLKNNESYNNGLVTWKIFYLYKLILKEVANPIPDLVDIDKGYNFNYFRGQSLSYSLVPGLFRKDVKPKLVSTFDAVYKRISEDYPDELEYVPYDSNNHESKRCEQIALLQHYGFPTPLIDITSNPYVSMEFMIDHNPSKQLELMEKDKKNPFKYEMFYIDKDNDKNIFVSVPKKKENKRIDAQHGAFFNCEKLSKIKLNSLNNKIIDSNDKIPRLVFEVNLIDDKNGSSYYLKKYEEDKINKIKKK